LNPLVSVVVTTYNQAAYIEQALKSVLAQTYEPFEVIVVDDGSTDDTPSRIAPFKDSINYIRQKNQGVAGSRNTGIREARGEYIAFLDGDDFWEPENIAAQVEVARNHPNAGLVVVDGVELNDSGIGLTSLLYGPYCQDLPEDRVTTGRYYHQLLHGQFICTTSQVMVPRRVFQTVGLSNGKFKRASDYDLYVRIAARFDVAMLKRRLTWWRYLSTSASGPRNLRGLRYLPEDIAVLRNQLKECDGTDRVLIRSIIERKVATGAETLYYHGLKEDRIFATCVLARLLRGNSTSPGVAIFLTKLWCPDVLTRTLGRIRRMLFPK